MPSPVPPISVETALTTSATSVHRMPAVAASAVSVAAGTSVISGTMTGFSSNG